VSVLPPDPVTLTPEVSEGVSWRWSGPADLISVRRGVLAGREFLERHAVPEEELNKWELVLSEAGNNAVNYARPEARHLPWSIELAIWPSSVVARVGDHTPGFALPAEAPFPGVDAENGRGLPIIFSLSARRRYDCHADGNVFTIERDLAAVPRILLADPVTEATLDSMTEELASAYESLAAIFRFTTEIARSSKDQGFASSCLQELLPVAGADWFVFRTAETNPSRLGAIACSGELQLPDLPLPADPSPVDSLEIDEPLFHVRAGQTHTEPVYWSTEFWHSYFPNKSGRLDGCSGILPRSSASGKNRKCFGINADGIFGRHSYLFSSTTFCTRLLASMIGGWFHSISSDLV